MRLLEKKKKDFFFLFFSTGMQVTPCQDEVTVTNKGAILNVEWLRSYETNQFLNKPMTRCVDFQRLHFLNILRVTLRLHWTHIWVVRFQFVDQAQICRPINNQK